LKERDTLNRPNILIVDDEQQMQLALKYSLQKSAITYKLKVAEDGFAALDQLRHQPFDLVITDYMMPGMNGLELIEGIRALSPNMPVIVTSAHEGQDLQILLKEADIRYFLPKPFTIKNLQDMVEEVLATAATASKQAKTLNEPKKQPNLAVEKELAALCTETGAYCSFVVESVGYLVAAGGETQLIPLPIIASLMAANAVAMATVSEQLGNPGSFDSMIHEGKVYSVASYELADNRILAVIYGKQVKTGLVQFYARRAIESLPKILPPAITTFDESGFAQNPVENFQESFSSSFDALLSSTESDSDLFDDDLFK
jgi:CheY-like chemotaxis protein/predicted regulator of Ras-like GTPase activity (Roadblock/LC7/MglB family)